MSTLFNNQSSDVDFYTKSGSRDGATVAILLEELGCALDPTLPTLDYADSCSYSLPYRVHKPDTDKNAVKEDWFLALNPNGRVPVLTDIHPDGRMVRLFETGSIVQYLIDTYDTDHRISYPKGSHEAIEVNNWLFFIKTGVVPNHGEAEHFTRQASQKHQYSVDRYKNETLRLYFIIEEHLAKAKTKYVVGEKWCVSLHDVDRLVGVYELTLACSTIADIALFPWVADVGSADIDIEEFPSLTAWQNYMMQRTAVERGMRV